MNYMKKIVLGVLAMMLSAGANCQDWNWRDMGGGAQSGYAQFEMFGSTQSVSVIRYKASRHRTEIVNDPAGLADSTSALAARHGAIGAVNGSYFDVDRLTPTTYVTDDGVREGRTFPEEMYRVDGYMSIRRGHKVSIALCDTASYAALTRNCRETMAAGPVLVLGGKAVREEWPQLTFYTKRHPRTVVGTTADGWVYLFVIDGRAKGNAAGATIKETAQIALMLGLENAINLDGGGSSTLWTREDGVLSHPTDNHRFDHAGQRVVPNVVIVR